MGRGTLLRKTEGTGGGTSGSNSINRCTSAVLDRMPLSSTACAHNELDQAETGADEHRNLSGG